MEYTPLRAEIPQYSVEPSLSTASFSVSGSLGSGVHSSSLSGLVTPSFSSVAFSSGSGLSPMALFESQVCHQWITKFEPEEREQFTSTFQEMRSMGTVYLTGYSSEALRTMWNQDLIRWGEEQIQENKLRSITLPIDPNYDLSGPYVGPPIFVRQPDAGNAVVIMNGNHRVAKVLFEGAPYSSSIYVLEFASPEASEQLLGTSPIGRCTNPIIPSVYSYTF